MESLPHENVLKGHLVVPLNGQLMRSTRFQRIEMQRPVPVLVGFGGMFLLAGSRALSLCVCLHCELLDRGQIAEYAVVAVHCGSDGSLDCLQLIGPVGRAQAIDAAVSINTRLIKGVTRFKGSISC